MKIYHHILVGSIVILMLSIFTPPVTAQTLPSIKLSTPFPHIEINLGQEISLEIEVKNLGVQYETLNLTVSEPENWNAALRSGDYVVKTVSLAPGENQSMELIVFYPEGENFGSYVLEITASDKVGNIVDSLDIIIDITEVSQIGKFGIVITSESPTVEGPGGSKFTYQIRVSNKSGEDRTIDLFSYAPQNWTVTFKPRFEDTVIRAVSTQAGESSRLDVEISPPPNVEAGKYTVSIQASSDPYEDNVILTVIITGTYMLSLSTPTGLLSLNAPQGEETLVPVIVKNEGSGQLTNIEIVSTQLPGWEISFEPNRVPFIPPNASAQVNVVIRPPNDSIPGDYEVRLRASAEPFFPSYTINLRVTVLGSTLWGIVGILLIVLVVVGLFVIFWRLGRR